MQLSEDLPEQTEHHEITSLGAGASQSARWKVAVAGAVIFLLGLGLGRIVSDPTTRMPGVKSRNAALLAQNADLNDELALLEDKVFSLKGKLADAHEAAEVAAGNGERIRIDYSEWDGLFSISGVNWVEGELVGQVTYLGGANCEPASVELKATYWRGGKTIGSDTTEFTNVTEGMPLLLENFASEGEQPHRTVVTLSDARC